MSEVSDRATNSPTKMLVFVKRFLGLFIPAGVSWNSAAISLDKDNRPARRSRLPRCEVFAQRAAEPIQEGRRSVVAVTVAVGVAAVSMIVVAAACGSVMGAVALSILALAVIGSTTTAVSRCIAVPR